MQEALDVLARKGSALVIAHRLSTVMDSERIYVLGGTKDKALGKQGEVIEYGTHEQLVKENLVLWLRATGRPALPHRSEPLRVCGGIGYL